MKERIDGARREGEEGKGEVKCVQACMRSAGRFVSRSETRGIRMDRMDGRGERENKKVENSYKTL